MAKDLSTKAQLRRIAARLEVQAGITTADDGDVTMEARLQRIANALDLLFFVGGPAVGSLEDLLDVESPLPAATGHVLEFDGTLWRTLFQSLKTHADVDSSLAPNDNDFLRFDTSSALFKTEPLNLKALDDISNGLAPASKHILSFGGVTWDSKLLPLIDLSDVNNTMSPSPNEFFKFVGSLWTSAVINFNDLADVFITGGSNNEIIKSSGGAWSSTDHILDEINDVNATIRIDRDLLQFQTSTTSWINRTLAAAGLLDRDGSITLTGPWDAGNAITASSFLLSATADHSITSVTNDLKITNPNADKSIIFNVFDLTEVSAYDFLFIRGDGPNLQFNPAIPITAFGGEGIIDITGSWGKAGAWAMIRFRPTITAGIPISFLIDPFITGPLQTIWAQYKPTVVAGQAWTVTGFEMDPGNVSAGNNQTFTIITESFTRIQTDGDSFTFTGLDLGAIASTTGAGSSITDTMIDLTGGGIAFTGSVTQIGLKLSGFGTILGGGAAIHAIKADGGFLSWVTDTGKIKMGAGEDAELFFDGSNFIIDPDPVTGAARVFIGVTGDDDMLLNTIEIDGDINHDGTLIGVMGIAPVARPAAYTQTFTPTTRTHPLFTSSALTDSTGGTTNNDVVAIPVVGGSGATTAQEGVIDDNFAELTQEHNALRVDLDQVKQLLNQVIDDFQAYGFLQ